MGAPRRSSPASPARRNPVRMRITVGRDPPGGAYLPHGLVHAAHLAVRPELPQPPQPPVQLGLLGDDATGLGHGARNIAGRSATF